MGGRLDVPAALVEWAARLLSVDRAEWGQAMLGELEQYKGAARWRFALGCAAAVVGLPRRSGNGRWVIASVLVASIASAGLVSYSFVRYPGMVTGAGTWMALAAFAVVLAGFVGLAGVTTRQSSIGITELVSGCALAGLSIVVVELSARSKASMLLLLIIPVASIVVGVVAARRVAAPDRWRGVRRWCRPLWLPSPCSSPSPSTYWSRAADPTTRGNFETSQPAATRTWRRTWSMTTSVRRWSCCCSCPPSPRCSALPAPPWRPDGRSTGSAQRGRLAQQH